MPAGLSNPGQIEWFESTAVKDVDTAISQTQSLTNRGAVLIYSDELPDGEEDKDGGPTPSLVSQMKSTLVAAGIPLRTVRYNQVAMRKAPVFNVWVESVANTKPRYVHFGPVTTIEIP